jgi:hypothetical protein
MNPDGIFVSNLGTQLINIETRNGGPASLDGVSVYVEVVADPGISAPLVVSSPAGGSVLATASFKSIFSADFTKATPGETVVSLIVQQQSGSQLKSVRLLKKIFVVGLHFNSATKTFECKVPQGSLYVHIVRAITPKPPVLGGGGGTDGGSGTDKCCCCCSGGGGSNGEPDPTIGRYIPYPIYIKSGTLLLVPSPTYAGVHGDLPFNDPWWKILLAIVAAILAAAGAIVAGAGGDDSTAGPEGTFEENDPSVHCCTGTGVSASTSNGIAAGLFAAAAAVATIAAASDDADWHERGQAATPPDKGALTTGEFVKFDIDYTQDPALGLPFKGKVSFNYERVLNTGM